jgi:cell division septation protein DedD
VLLEQSQRRKEEACRVAEEMELFDTTLGEIRVAEDLRSPLRRRRSAERSIIEGRRRSEAKPERRKGSSRDLEIRARKGRGPDRSLAKGPFALKREREFPENARHAGGSAEEDSQVLSSRKARIIREPLSKNLSVLKVLVFIGLGCLVAISLKYFGVLDFSGSDVPPRMVKKEINLPQFLEETSVRKPTGPTEVSELKSIEETPANSPQFREESYALTVPMGPQEDSYGRGLAQDEKAVSYPYSIYLGSYQSLDAATKAASEYKEKGLPPYWVRVDLGKKGIWYRIFMGHFSQGKEAEAIIKKNQWAEATVKETKYSALIGIYSSKDQLEKDSLALSSLGFCPYVIEKKKGDFELHSGAFYTRAKVEEHRNELASKGIQSQVVER